MIDGELLILDEDGKEEFDALQNRLHPAESRVRMLAEKTPALFRAFDLLAVGDHSALDDPFTERRRRSSSWSRASAMPGSIELTPLVGDPAEAEPWLETGEGVIAKRSTRPICAASARRWSRSSACGRSTPSSSAGGPGKEENTVGSLILGLYDEDGELHVVGHTSGLKAKQKRELVDDARPVRERRAGLGRSQPLGGRPRPRMGRRCGPSS